MVENPDVDLGFQDRGDDLELALATWTSFQNSEAGVTVSKRRRSDLRKNATQDNSTDIDALSPGGVCPGHRWGAFRVALPGFLQHGDSR